MSRVGFSWGFDQFHVMAKSWRGRKGLREGRRERKRETENETEIENETERKIQIEGKGREGAETISSIKNIDLKRDQRPHEKGRSFILRTNQVLMKIGP